MIPFGRRRSATSPVLTRQQALSCVPVKAPSVQAIRSESQTVVISFVEPLHPVLSAIRRAFGKASEGRIRKVELDAMGTSVWDWIDGVATVADLAVRFTERYGVLRQEAELSVSQFLRELGKRGIILLHLPKVA